MLGTVDLELAHEFPSALRLSRELLEVDRRRHARGANYRPDRWQGLKAAIGPAGLFPRAHFVACGLVRERRSARIAARISSRDWSSALSTTCRRQEAAKAAA